MGASREPKVGSSMHLNKIAAIMCSLKCTESHGSLVWPVQSLTAV